MLWEVHQDTVGVDGMKIDPFAGAEADGRIWGRGACDVKGAMAAMLVALSRVVDEGAALARPIVLAMTINEERGFSGVKSLSRLWSDEETATAEFSNVSGDLSFEEIRVLRPAAALVAEPTLLDVVVAHKGGVAWQCRALGKAAHSSQPERGINAVSAIAHLVRTVEQFDVEVLRQREPHPLCGLPSACVSTIHGGTGANTVPDHAVMDIDCRLLPHERPAEARQTLIDYLARATEGVAATIQHDDPANQCVGLRDDNNHDWARQIAAVVDSVTDGSSDRSSQLIGVPFGTDAWVLSEIGIPTVVFGPGSIDQAHTDDEWIDIEQLELAAEVFYRLAIKP
ncbi:MAG: M20/M25/M40 family metallo-hydrolase [Planctomycetota bacterium]